MQQETKGSSRRRKQVVDLNLVPFIDLMSVCIIFLLITAVWTQVSMVQLGSSIYAPKTEEKSIVPPPFTEVVLRVDILPQGYRFVLGREKTLIPSSQGAYDKQGLLARLKLAKTTYPQKIDGVASIQDEIAYKHLIEAMDAFNLAGFPQISITTTGVR